jgi:NTE family protein
MARRALVLGAGGHAASAWEIDLIAGMAEVGADVRNADLFVGTSAGARVAVQLASEVAPAALLARQMEPTTEPAPDVDWLRWRSDFARAQEGGGAPAQILRRIGAFAVKLQTKGASHRRNLVASEILVEAWPDRQILIATVEAETGERRVFDRTSGIVLIDAVLASTAVAGIRPAIAFQGRHYFDGGFYSTDNADLAAGYDRVLIVTLRAGVPPFGIIPLEAATDSLERGGAQVAVVHPDDATQAVFASFGGNLLNPALRAPAAAAGQAQGRRVASGRIAAFWK